MYNVYMRFQTCYRSYKFLLVWIYSFLKLKFYRILVSVYWVRCLGSVQGEWGGGRPTDGPLSPVVRGEVIYFCDEQEI